MGQLLKADHNVVVANEVNVFNLLRRPGFSREQILTLILERDAAYTSGARKPEGYQYVTGRPVAGAL